MTVLSYGELSSYRDYSPVIVAAALVPISLKLFSLLIPKARTWGLIDRPGGRHLHAMPVAVVGGIGVVATWLLGLGLCLLLMPGWGAAHAQELVVTSALLLAVLVIGVADDTVGLPPTVRLVSELLIAASTVALNPAVRDFCVEVARVLGFVVYPLVTLGIVGVMNAMNLVDGLDGLAGSMFLSISVAITLLSLPTGDNPAPGGVIALLLTPGLIGFLRKNWSPAATFMGDHGSLAVGYLLVVSALGVRSHGVMHSLSDIALLATLFSYPVLDMIICMVRRFQTGQPVATGDRNHMHHRMLRLGLSARESVAGLMAWQFAMLSPAFLIRPLAAGWSPLILITSIAIAVERLLLLGRIEGARLRQYQQRLYNLLKPRDVPRVDPAFVRAKVLIPLRSLIEAAQFEESGCLEQMVQTLRFYCERKVKGTGFVEVTESEIVISLVGSTDRTPTATELRDEWARSLLEFSKLFKLTYPTRSLPIEVKTVLPIPGERNLDAIEAA